DFFSTGEILRQINHSVIALIPKLPSVTSVADFRPISCCNVIYKVISKILATRLAAALQSIISPAQNAFLGGRKMTDNINLVQELLRQYGRKRASPRCLVVSLIMKCVESTSFSVSVNGNLYGFFQGKSGIRQGDPFISLFIYHLHGILLQNGIVQFWLSIFPMPAQVLRQITRICRNFLWNGNVFEGEFCSGGLEDSTKVLKSLGKEWFGSIGLCLDTSAFLGQDGGLSPVQTVWLLLEEEMGVAWLFMDLICLFIRIAGLGFCSGLALCCLDHSGLSWVYDSHLFWLIAAAVPNWMLDSPGWIGSLA
ncbi:uncharacterized protein LOC119993955, partial [Tripterygium wilfordii]|uniref:uncharacterized protein LOC119993955 n=1 Tax=Tripterygium wilfordii TaxID=458696 RepID=UPI0018F84ACB